MSRNSRLIRSALVGTILHRQPDGAVEDRTSLCSPSPKNGNFSNVDQRLSAKIANFDSTARARDRRAFKKRRTCGLFRQLRRQKAGDRTGWLGRQDSNREIPFSELAFETTREFRVLLRNCGPETFTRQSCRNGQGHPAPSASPAAVIPSVQSCCGGSSI